MAKEKKQKRHTPLSQHQKVGSKLISPMSALNMTPIEWTRDLLPEHLWLCALADHFGLGYFHKPYNDFMDAVDKYSTRTETNLGFLSDLGHIPSVRQVDFRNEHEDLIQFAFVKPLGNWLALYPESPAAWLIKDTFLPTTSIDPIVELARLRTLVVKLLPGADSFAGRVRAVPLNRLFKHDKLRIFRNLETTQLVIDYRS